MPVYLPQARQMSPDLLNEQFRCITQRCVRTARPNGTLPTVAGHLQSPFRSSYMFHSISQSGDRVLHSLPSIWFRLSCNSMLMPRQLPSGNADRPDPQDAAGVAVLWCCVPAGQTVLCEASALSEDAAPLKKPSLLSHGTNLF
jgi:hypothetical protein